VVRSRCETSNPCHHECVDTGVAIHCRCFAGFRLQPDARSCTGRPKPITHRGPKKRAGRSIFHCRSCKCVKSCPILQYVSFWSPCPPGKMLLRMFSDWLSCQQGRSHLSLKQGMTQIITPQTDSVSVWHADCTDLLMSRDHRLETMLYTDVCHRVFGPHSFVFTVADASHYISLYCRSVLARWRHRPAELHNP